MKIRARILLIALTSLLTSPSFAHSSQLLSPGNVIPISGTAFYGFAETYGDFNISGPGLTLVQGLPQGPSDIGLCRMGAVCNFSFAINTSGASFCAFCLYYSSGSVGSNVAEFLIPNLIFTGSALYTGASTMTVPMTVRGTIVGYQLLNCDGAVSCTLGPVVFRLSIAGTATGQFTIQTGQIQGVMSTFTGTATLATPEPMSLLLTATGLAAILIRKAVAAD